MITSDTLSLLNNFAMQIYGTPLAYVDGQGFFLVRRVGEETVLHPFDDSVTLFADTIAKTKKVYFLDSAKDVSLLLRNAVATLSVGSRYTVATTSQLVGEPSASQKKLAEKYNLKDFSTTLQGQQKQLATLTYNLILEALEKANRQKKSKTKIITEFYNPALSAVAQKDMLKLEQIKDDIVTHLGKQTRAIESRQIQQAKATLWKDVKRRLFWLSFGIVAIIFLFVGRVLYRPTANTSAVTQVEVTLEPNMILEAIKEYEENNDVNIYKWRRDKIITTLTGSTMTDQQLSDTIDYFVTKAWQKK